MNSFITKINLNNFRNYDNFSIDLDFDKKFTIIAGENGSGKTNILEAISLFSAGKGLKKAETVNLQNIANPEKSWGISIDLYKQEKTIKLGTGAIPTSLNRRLLKIDGEFVRSRATLAEYLTVIWLIPQLDKIFIEAKTIRQKYFDTMVNVLFKEASKDFFEYEKALRERNKILKELSIIDPIWLTTLEDKLAETGYNIAIFRQSFCSTLNDCITSGSCSTSFPKAEITPLGDIEELTQKHEKQEAIDLIKKTLRENRIHDKQRGSTSFGAHRTDFFVKYLGKDMEARLCSTGEQKSLLIGLFLSFAKVLKDKENTAPIVLLDEIAAHLDEDKKENLFEELKILNSQVFITGTHEELFNSIKKISNLIKL